MAKRTLQLISILFTVAGAISAHASQNFGDEAMKCLLLAPAASLKCAPNQPCPSQDVKTKVQSCLDKMGLKNGACGIHYQKLECRLPGSDLLFPQSKGCELSLTTFHDGTPNFRLDSPTGSKGKCVFHGYTSEGAGFPVQRAIAQKNGKWIAPKPVIAFGFDKTFPPQNVIIVGFARINEEEWEDGEGGKSCPESTVKLATPYGQSTGGAERAKALGFEKIQVSKAERHYIGREGKGEFSIINSFQFRKDTELCSYKIPKGTTITTKFDDRVCVSLVDGTIRVAGLPLEIFPNLAETEGVSPHATVTCAPSAIKSSSQWAPGISGDARTRSIQIPPLDWQDCDCQIERDRSLQGN